MDHDGLCVKGTDIAFRGLSDRDLLDASRVAPQIAGPWLWTPEALRTDGWSCVNGLWRPPAGDLREEFAMGERRGPTPDVRPVPARPKGGQPRTRSGAGGGSPTRFDDWRSWWLDPHEGWLRRDASRMYAVGRLARRRRRMAGIGRCPVCKRLPCPIPDLERSYEVTKPSQADMIVGASLRKRLEEIGRDYMCGAPPAVVVRAIVDGLTEQGVAEAIERSIQASRARAERKRQAEAEAEAEARAEAEAEARAEAEAAPAAAQAAPPRTSAQEREAHTTQQQAGGQR